MSDYSYYRGQNTATSPDQRSGHAYTSNGGNTYSSSYHYAPQPYNGAGRLSDPSYPPEGRYPATTSSYSSMHDGAAKGSPPHVHHHPSPPTHVGRNSYDYHHGRSPVSPHSPMSPDTHGYAHRGTSPYDSSPTYSQSFSTSHVYSHSQDHVMIPPYSNNIPLSSSPTYSDYGSSLPRAFTCDTCPLSFHRQHDLKRHEKTHSGSKPYTCNGGCGKTFTRKDALKRHQLVKKCGTFDDSLT